MIKLYVHVVVCGPEGISAVGLIVDKSQYGRVGGALGLVRVDAEHEPLNLRRVGHETWRVGKYVSGVGGLVGSSGRSIGGSSSGGSDAKPSDQRTRERRRDHSPCVESKWSSSTATPLRRSSLAASLLLWLSPVGSWVATTSWVEGKCLRPVIVSVIELVKCFRPSPRVRSAMRS